MNVRQPSDPSRRRYRQRIWARSRTFAWIIVVAVVISFVHAAAVLLMQVMTTSTLLLLLLIIALRAWREVHEGRLMV